MNFTTDSAIRMHSSQADEKMCNYTYLLSYLDKLLRVSFQISLISSIGSVCKIEFKENSMKVQKFSGCKCQQGDGSLSTLNGRHHF